MASIDQILAHAQEVTDLSVIAITEHDDIRPSLAARELAAGRSSSVEVVTGMEVTTRAGHVLALFVDQPIRSFRTPDASIAAIHEAGGLALIPHPLSWLTRSIGERVMRRLLLSEETRPDGIEISPSPAARVTRRRAQEFNASEWNLAEYGSSDAHFLESVGSVVTLFPGGSAADLRAALESRATSAELRWSVSPRQLGWRRVVRQQWRGLCVTPRKIIGGAVTARLRAGG